MLINFCLSLWENLALSYIMANILLVFLSSPDNSLHSSDSMVSIYTSKLLGPSKFQLCLCSLNIWANSAQLVEAPDLSNVPPKYHKFTNFFSKTKAKVLVSHCPYDLQINLEKSAQPPVGFIYFLLTFKQETLKKFIEENLNMGFIQPILLLYSAPVLFVKKKNGSLHLCINFCSLNHKRITIHFYSFPTY